MAKVSLATTRTNSHYLSTQPKIVKTTYMVPNSYSQGGFKAPTQMLSMYN